MFARMTAIAAALVIMLVNALPAMAQEGVAAPWQLNLQQPATPVLEMLTSFHNLLLVIIFAISIFVLVLLVYTVWRFRAAANPNPSRSTHNTILEIVWTAVPVLILVVIAIPSFKALYFMDRVDEADMTLKAIGRQWYWSYEYPDYENFTFDAYMLQDEAERSEVAAQLGMDELPPRLLGTDNAVVVPAGATVRLLVTSSDVLHSWAMPSFGIKTDAVPGRLNETWFRVDEPGIYYGQCSELCGTFHGFMPIMVRVVPQEEFDTWVAQAQSEFAKVDGADDLRLAAN
ncbi:MAG: cytochrome c oxidase subunit II [Geminicoccaceae bacterium]